MIELAPRTPLHLPRIHGFEDEGIRYAVDGEAPGLPLDQLVGIVDQACGLGLERLYITGGEPFVRRDLFELLRHASEERNLDVVVLTNATVFKGRIRSQLRELDRERVHFQVSVDGARAETNDAVRGPGTFEAALEGARLLAELGFQVSLTTVTTTHNLRELPEIPRWRRRWAPAAST